MGFGFVVLGYFFANLMSLRSLLAFAMPIGYLLAAIGFYRLMAYERRFLYSLIASACALPFALYFAAYSLFLLGVPLDGAWFADGARGVWTLLYTLFLFAFHFALLYPVAALCGQTGLPALVAGAWRNLIFVGVFTATFLFSKLPFLGGAAKYFTLPLLSLRLIYIFLVTLLLWQAYRTLTDPEENKPPEITDRRKEKGQDAEEQ